MFEVTDEDGLAFVINPQAVRYVRQTRKMNAKNAVIMFMDSAAPPVVCRDDYETVKAQFMGDKQNAKSR